MPARDADIAFAVERLNGQLPLQARQQALPEEWRRLHRHILYVLAHHGRVPSRAEIAARVTDAEAALARLSSDDLIVLDRHGNTPVGAYPMTTEPTPHHLQLETCGIFAMCALDALAVAPMFDCEARIISRCRVTDEPVDIRQRGMEILSITPSPAVQVGIRWQAPVGCAARSMCTEMVFLRDPGTAERWRAGDLENTSLFRVDRAVAFAAAFFMPLLKD